VISTHRETLAGDSELPDGDYAVVAVSDSGTGISPEILERVCEPFFTTKSLGQGTGLGLAMVFGLAQQSSGRLRIASTVGEGTRVELLLPRTDETAEIADAPALRTVAPVGSARILVVDDDADVRHVTASFLSSFGYRETEAGDAREALDLLASQDFDLVVADLAMPGMTGVELVNAIRRHGLTVPVLILTGHAEAVEIPAGVPVLAKPFESSELAATVANLIAPTTRL